SVSIAFQRCQKCLEAGLGSIHHSKFTVTRTFSSGSQLVALKLRKWHNLIIFNAITSTARRQFQQWTAEWRSSTAHIKKALPPVHDDRQQRLTQFKIKG
ncbi:hypothetical protein, partial [Lactiplantibacillus pentosus]|uniref:hypothetical protein n=2 Tax=Lactiplantibacillus pentosus TaxID=1589 RepID=UPI0021A90216